MISKSPNKVFVLVFFRSSSNAFAVFGQKSKSIGRKAQENFCWSCISRTILTIFLCREKKSIEFKSSVLFSCVSKGKTSIWQLWATQGPSMFTAVEVCCVLQTKQMSGEFCDGFSFLHSKVLQVAYNESLWSTV